MLTTKNVINYSGQKTISFYLSVDTLSFDYENMTRDCSVSLYASGGESGVYLTSETSGGSVTAFGKTFVLPQRVAFNSSGTANIGSWTVQNISNSSYPSSASCAVALSYRCDLASMYDHSGSFIINIGRMHLSPAVSVVGGSRSRLGSFLEFSGDIFSEGYDIDASVKYGISTYYKYSLQNTRNGFYSEGYWIAEVKNATSFTATVTLSASYNGKALPQTYSVPVTFYLGENDGLPYADIATGFTSENEAIAALSFGIKNKSAFYVSVTDVHLHYGASITRCAISIDGVETSAESAETEILTESGEHTWSVTLRDSRGKSNKYIGTFTVMDYGLPEFTASVKRTDEMGAESKRGTHIRIAITPEKEYTFDGANEYAYSFTYTAVGGVKSDPITVLSGEEIVYNAALDDSVVYHIEVKCADSFGSETVRSYTLESERVELNIAKNKVAVGKKAQKERVFQSAWDIEGDGDISFVDTSGERLSLRALSLKDNVRCAFVSASDESGIEATLDAISKSETSGCLLNLVSVTADGLSLEKGLHVYVSVREGEKTLVQKLG